MENIIYKKFQQIVELFPDSPAILENNRTLSFAQLSGMVREIADQFPEHIRAVGVVMTHRAEMIAAILAILRRGGMYVPAEPSFPEERIRAMMREARVDFVLTERPFVKKLQGLPLRLQDGEATGAKSNDGTSPARAESLAYVLYTSGTTGRPKGVAVTNANVCHYARAFENEFHNGPGDIMLQYSVCSFDIFVEEVFASLLNGAGIAIPSPKDTSSVTNLMAFVRRHGVTMISGFPYLLEEINRLEELPPSLRLCISGGDVLRGRYVDRLLDKVAVYNTYGPSETTVCATYYRCDQNVLEDGTYPIGRAVKDVCVKILDADGNELPVGAQGEICIFGNGVSRGYIGDHDEENKAFVKLPDGETMYRSGDLGYLLPDGNIAFLRRKDTQIMIYGKRVEVAEVESTLARCAGIREAVVKAFTDESGLSYMTAYIVPENPDIRLSDIRRELSRYLTDFMIPQFFVRLPAIPINTSGKPDSNQLPVVMKE